MDAKIIRANVELVTEDGESMEVRMDDLRGLHVEVRNPAMLRGIFELVDGSRRLTITRDKD